MECKNPFGPSVPDPYSASGASSGNTASQGRTNIVSINTPIGSLNLSLPFTSSQQNGGSLTQQLSTCQSKTHNCNVVLFLLAAVAFIIIARKKG